MRGRFGVRWLLGSGPGPRERTALLRAGALVRRRIAAGRKQCFHGGMSEADEGSPRHGQAIEVHDQTVEVVERAEGYRELRCRPATWSYPGRRPIAELLTEYYSQRMDVDPYGTQSGGIWSGSDAALRLQRLPADDLALREITALASRRSTGLNAPSPWVSSRELETLAKEWEGEARDIHFSQRPPVESRDNDLWTQYGMTETPGLEVITGYAMGPSRVRPSTQARADGGLGSWQPWSVVATWKRWPRRQQASASVPGTGTDGHLRIFVSHRWESLDHPDPDGAQLLALNVGLTLSLAAAVLAGGDEFTTRSRLPELFRAHLRRAHHLGLLGDAALRRWASQVREVAQGATNEESFDRDATALDVAPVDRLLRDVRERVLIWYDYVSMFQAPRTEDEEVAFRAEILQLNAIQSRAATVVIAGDVQYVERAWCFLELCGGLRGAMAELTPSWGTSLDVGTRHTRWTALSDQLIGALNVLGVEAIQHSGLEATHPTDLPVVARLISELPLTGKVETDDSDLVGGVIPIPRRGGGWVLDVPSDLDEGAVQVAELAAAGFTTVPHHEELCRARASFPTVDSLVEPVGIWVYTTQRTLSLVWALRAQDFWSSLQGVLDLTELGVASAHHGQGLHPQVACMWADARGLAEDGLGWTRIVPSTASVLVVVTQADLPPICRIYERVVGSHLAAGATVITYTPDSGAVTLHRPALDGPRAGQRQRARRTPPQPTPVEADVLALPRVRRSDAYPRQLLLRQRLSTEDLEVCAALRLDPARGTPLPGMVTAAVAASGVGTAGTAISASDMLAYRDQRVRVEARARSVAGTWEQWFEPRLQASAWSEGMATTQLDVIEQLIDAVAAGFDNPFRRRRLLDVLVTEHEGYALPPWIVGEAAQLIEGIGDLETQAGDAPQ